eukprot:CAMPEP_0118956470 /NCGR_PEP_ID=MMETSP1169-20130426/61595_1 /TAXON_ID=36882 /ORGANISM="Pyramimonas obovata, Strain CCMP722" /LENGTH=225 /DNA_ID=CAMNT_0006904503 /DNA_START=589 /DNA_END=1266 /DNA_ORIENTATION=-
MAAAMISSTFLGKAVAPVRAHRQVSNGSVTKMAMEPNWCPGRPRPAYLDGSLAGDFGFDPLGLGADTATLARFQEAELISARWAMLGAMGVISVEALGYGDWYSAALAPTQTYFGTEVPFDVPTLAIIEFLAMAYLEAKRNEETDPVKRCYPGGAFDPMGMSKDAAKFEELKLKEIKNGRLAMLAMAGFYAQTSTGTTPLANWAAHVADPWHVNVSTNAIAIPYL